MTITLDASFLLYVWVIFIAIPIYLAVRYGVRHGIEDSKPPRRPAPPPPVPIGRR